MKMLLIFPILFLLLLCFSSHSPQPRPVSYSKRLPCSHFSGNAFLTLTASLFPWPKTYPYPNLQAFQLLPTGHQRLSRPGMPEPRVQRVQLHPLPFVFTTLRVHYGCTTGAAGASAPLAFCIFNFVGAVRVQTMGATGAQNFYNRQN